MSLSTLLKSLSSPLPLNNLIKVAQGITLGLQYLHSSDPQIIHRDLKVRAWHYPLLQLMIAWEHSPWRVSLSSYRRFRSIEGEYWNKHHDKDRNGLVSLLLCFLTLAHVLCPWDSEQSTLQLAIWHLLARYAHSPSLPPPELFSSHSIATSSTSFLQVCYSTLLSLVMLLGIVNYFQLFKCVSTN